MAKDTKEVKKVINKTEVRSCTCNHLAQDKRYGIKKRVHNYAPKTQGGAWRCTSCSKVSK